ncbi:MAG: hypothetical protein ACPL06_03900 [Candidatus Anstonellales archaeon]
MTVRRNRTFSAVRKMKRKTMEGTKTVYRRRKTKPSALCAVCGARLGGIGKGTKTMRRPERKFGGALCHRCTAEIIKYSTRVRSGAISMEDVPLGYKKYIEGMR